jgi:hypothetical protein
MSTAILIFDSVEQPLSISILISISKIDTVECPLSEMPSKKRAAVLLACVGFAAHAVFRTFQFKNPADKTGVKEIVRAFKKHFIGDANVTYKRYMFLNRVLQACKLFDHFLADLFRLARTR